MKYIIDIPNELAEATARYWSETTDMTLVPYTEPDRKAIEDKVWEFVRTCLVMDGSDFVDAFDSCSYINLLEYSYQVAKAKYESWLKQKDEIHVGDEVENTSHKKGIVINHYISSSNGLEYVRVLYMDDDGNSFISAWGKNDVCKTGKHFDEVEEMLKKMKECDSDD